MTPVDSPIGTGASLQRIREQRPLVHQITNFVVMNETANATLAIGALPVMAHAPEEVAEMASVAGALVLNIGTLTLDWVASMILAGHAANRAGVPVVLDPVGAGATSLRTRSAERILDELDIAIVRGNAAEVASIAGQSAQIRGVESMGTGQDAAELASMAARKLRCVVAVTGAVDAVSDGTTTLRVANGHPMLATVTGTGCIASALAGCFAAVNHGAPLRAAVEALVALGVAGEDAATQSRGPGSFHVGLYDALYALLPETIDSRARVTLG
ncbi:MAG TPA: hydroxyethylthiazole kinase [Candidatus Dormibacteraeota bacterium]|jgi:hydroxyethylthiazole kinase|nr:hydroxyethylthiazole kinase [Candidatus Dormibacteraeota bacterium]